MHGTRHCILMVPKFHCELNWVRAATVSPPHICLPAVACTPLRLLTAPPRPLLTFLCQIERKWAFIKQAIKRYTTSTMPGLVAAYKKVIPTLTVQTCRRFARKTRDYNYARIHSRCRRCRDRQRGVNNIQVSSVSSLLLDEFHPDCDPTIQ
jgi:hypothetical protein